MDERKTFLAENRWPIIFTLLVLVVGTATLYVQGYFERGGDVKVNPAVFREMKLKLLFEGSDPELLAYIPPRRLSSYPTIMGDPVPDDDSMVLGYEEARDMTSESNITMSDAIWGFTINDFLGEKIRVSGMLKKTGTLLDMMHILPQERFKKFGPGESIEVKLNEEKMPKFFYYINAENSNWPKDVKFAQGSEKYFKSQKADKKLITVNLGNINVQVTENKTYVPLVLGSKEAKMMREEKIFSEVGDKIDDFFGKRVVVVGILNQTDTVLDMFHYLPAE